MLNIEFDGIILMLTLKRDVNMENLKDKIINQLQKYKKSNITLDVIYQLSGLTIVPSTIHELNACINELINEEVIQPLKTSKKNVRGMYVKYRIIKHDNALDVKEEIVQTLIKPIKIEYYLKNPKEYVQDREFIQTINNYLKSKENEHRFITANERSYQLFKNEKLLKENENVLNKLGIGFETLNCYDTYEPFFFYINPQFQGNDKIVIIIENKDTFWSTKKAIESNSDVYMVIYGEGKKILKSFLYIKEFDISNTNRILYFGDIDYEGINICMSLIHSYPNFNIQIFKNAYRKCLELEENLQKMHHNQNKVKHYIEEFCKDFDTSSQEKLKYIFENNCYIPQEILTFEELKKVIETIKCY